MPASEAEVRHAFDRQAQMCDALGCDFTATLCRTLRDLLDRSTKIGRAVLDWPGNPLPSRDSVSLRLCAGLHFLVKSGTAGELALLYPPHPRPSEPTLRAALVPVLRDHGEALVHWLDSMPQTNEVARSAPLAAGLMAAVSQFPLPLELYELGASAGLNLLPDRYAYRFGQVLAGDPGSALRLEPQWLGRPPRIVPFEVASRRGVDLRPLDVAADRMRLTCFVLPEQADRLQRLDRALAIAAPDPPIVDQGDAATWVEQRIALEPTPGRMRVLFHSLAFQFFEAASQDRIARHMERAGEGATADAPVAWLRLEMARGEPVCTLRLRLWPGEDRLLGFANPHGDTIWWDMLPPNLQPTAGPGRSSTLIAR